MASRPAPSASFRPPSAATASIAPAWHALTPRRGRKYWNARQATLVTYTLILTNVLVFVYILIETPKSLMGSTDAIGYIRLGLSRDLSDQRPLSRHPRRSSPASGTGWSRRASCTTAFSISASTCMRCTCSARRSSRCSAGCGSAWSTSRACWVAVPGHSCCNRTGLHGGASGAVFGLFGLIIVGYLQRGINPLTTSLGGVLIVNVLLSFSGGISFGGHLGGAIAGMICGWVMMAPAQRRVPEKWTYITPILVGLGSIAVAVATTL